MSSLAYHFGNGLYLNVTNRCTNSCSFCIRNGHDTVGDSDVLWLDNEPTAEELCAALQAEMLPETQEIVFCGYGEPLMRLDTVLAVCRFVRDTYPSLPIRINTNGHGDLLFGGSVAPLLEGLADTVSVSLNAPNPARYNEICSPVFDGAFEAVLSFASECKKYVPNVCLSVVDQPLSEEEIQACHLLAREFNIPLRVRAFE